MLKIKEKIYVKSKFSGIDSLTRCRNVEHFKNYKKSISYVYNSNGFRDVDWPSDTSDSIWCLGDSFTVGIGQPFKETWPKQLEKVTGKKCINVGEDGCSNDILAERAKKIYQKYKPKLIIIMWSYFHRRKNLHYDKKDFGMIEDFKNFIKNYKSTQKIQSKIVHLLIPNAMIGNKKHLNYFIKKNNLIDVLVFEQLDYGRDYHHFDIKTSRHICKLIKKKIAHIDKRPK